MIRWDYMRIDIEDTLNDTLKGLYWIEDDEEKEMWWELSGAMTGISVYLQPTPSGNVRISDHQSTIKGGWELSTIPDLENLDETDDEYKKFLNQVAEVGREALWQTFE